MDYWQILRSALGKQQVIMPSAVGAIVKDGRVLLVKSGSSQGSWGLPGGLQELNESVSDTVVRELREELGVKCEVDRLIGVYSSPRFIFDFPNGDRIQQVLFFFQMKEISDPDFKLQAEEVSEYAFFDLDHLPDDILPCCREKIGDMLAFNGTVVMK